ncbi:haloacid dehalogenase type II [Silicimonas sp. MF1-12-2]|uniref:haloacid dehalogenase type II n=1 Tax=Silicimonas sp. MF1-12-2 TaxID=3384793 RepID=UPI0039B42CFB
MRQALIFDVFGTCVDWRSSVARQVADVLPGVDPLSFADAWRAEYQPAMERIRAGNRGYVPLDDLHFENLQVVLDRLGVVCSDLEQLSRAWERLAPWPDTVPGLLALKKSHIVAPCSNGSIALMTRLGKYSGMPWDCILGADLARDYKPKAEVYRASVAALRLQPSEVVMVAAHNDDLFAARAAGLKTAFVARPTEHGPGQMTDLAPESDWDWIATDFLHLAEQMA